MKNKRSFILIFVIVLFFAVIVYDLRGIYENSGSGETFLNSVTNIRDGGYVIKTEDYYYYTNHDDYDRLYRMNINSNETELFADHKFYYEMSLLNGYIYYISSAPGKIYKISTETGRETKLVNELASHLIISEEGMYYIRSEYDDWGKLYSADLKGNNRKLLANKVLSFSLCGNIIYYINMEDNNSVWRYNLLDDTAERLIDCKADCIDTNDKYIFYTEADESHCLFRYNTETQAVECICRDICYGFNLYGDLLYYRNQSDGGNLYKINTDGSKKELTAEGNISNINIVDDLIFFRRVTENKGYFYKEIGENGIERKWPPESSL